MAYEFDPTSNKLHSSAGPLRARLSKTVSTNGGTIIPPYKLSNGWGATNRVRALQEFFKPEGSHRPVFLRGPRDYMIYRGVMIFSLLGIGVTLYSIGLMATGRMKKKGET